MYSWPSENMKLDLRSWNDISQLMFQNEHSYSWLFIITFKYLTFMGIIVLIIPIRVYIWHVYVVN